MKITPLRTLKSDKRGIVISCGPLNYVARKKGSVSGDHPHPEDEYIYLVKGKAKMIEGNTSEEVSAPAEVVIPKNHIIKLLATTDVVFLEGNRR